ncbi:MAG: response regulator [Bdellovibrio sp.]|nr:response regulator [Bdellovibrio sp.]
MAFLIAIELFTLVFALSTLSSVRAFVGGEGLWSKAQKNAIHSLNSYIFTKESSYYDDFKVHMQIPLGDRIARKELSKSDPDLKVVTDGFLQGGIHPQDIPGVINILRRFHDVSYIKTAVSAWTQADALLDKVIQRSEELRELFSANKVDQAEVKKVLSEINALNSELTRLEVEFSTVLGEGSRWLENVLMFILILAVFTVESTGLFLTVSFGRNLNRSLLELNDAANEIGRGNLGVEVPVRSKDELGQLAASINKMSRDLDANVSQRLMAENANQVKTLFLANMSHEIRTPLGIILGMTDILKDPQVSDQEKLKYLEIIEKTGRNLTRIINDILDITKVESGHLEIEPVDFPLRYFMDELESMMRIKATDGGNILKVESTDQRPLEIITDRNRLKQILVNLINNALKFTQKGEVKVTYGSQGDKVVFEVSDTGIGIPENAQENLFQNFFQADSSSTRKYEGTGLGLVLSKKLARSLGGDVVLKNSVMGKGSVFQLIIPLKTIATVDPNKLASPPVQTPLRSLENRTVLVVDDSFDNQMLIQHYLKKRGAVCDFAGNGNEAIVKAMANPYDIILMDMQMPIMDGYTATRKLREQNYQRPIVALTAHAMKEDRERCLKVGCNDYLTKPVEAEQLYRTLHELIHA